MSIKPKNPSLSTLALTLALAVGRKTVTLREALLARAQRKLEDAVQSAGEYEVALDRSTRADLEEEADEIVVRIVARGQAAVADNERMNAIGAYLTPSSTPRPQVPEGAGLTAPSEKILDEDDAPEGYKAVPWSACGSCAFGDGQARCPRRIGDEDGWLHCVEHNRPDWVEVMFVKRRG